MDRPTSRKMNINKVSDVPTEIDRQKRQRQTARHTFNIGKQTKTVEFLYFLGIVLSLRSKDHILAFLIS